MNKQSTAIDSYEEVFLIEMKTDGIKPKLRF